MKRRLMKNLNWCSIEKIKRVLKKFPSQDREIFIYKFLIAFLKSKILTKVLKVKKFVRKEDKKR